MVYVRLLIVCGAILTHEQASKLVKPDEDGDICCTEAVMKINTRPIDLYSYPCCTEIRGEKYLVGEVVHTYYRKNVKCEKCPSYCVCDNCIGITNNGHYDVDKIINTPTTVPLEELCQHCFAHNRKNLGGITEDFPIINNRIQFPEKFVDPKMERCEICNLRNDTRFTPQKVLEQSYRCTSTRRKLLELGIDVKFNYYFFVDDCLSCT